ncbi:MAG: efflux RND transporter periplasmic adaptor subunit, partial [Acetobacteraceae bacterium]
MRRAILVLIALATLGLAVWALMPRPVQVGVATVAPRTISVTVTEEGEAEIREVFTVSAPIAGRMQRIRLHAGDPVAVGDTVAMIGPVAPALLDARSRAVAEAGLAAADSAVKLAEAQLAQAEALFAFKITEADRSMALFDRGAI